MYVCIYVCVCVCIPCVSCVHVAEPQDLMYTHEDVHHVLFDVMKHDQLTHLLAATWNTNIDTINSTDSSSTVVLKCSSVHACSKHVLMLKNPLMIRLASEWVLNTLYYILYLLVYQLHQEGHPVWNPCRIKYTESDDPLWWPRKGAAERNFFTTIYYVYYYIK